MTTQRLGYKEQLRALSRPNRTDPRYPIEAYEDDLVALLQQAELRGRIDEQLNHTRVSFASEINSRKDRIATLEAQLKTLTPSKEEKR